MQEKDLLLNTKHDLKMVDFDLQLTKNDQIVAQRVKQALLLFKGEWFLDIDAGVPYYESILGQKKDLDTIRAIYVSTIRSVKGVKDLTELNIEYDNNVRVISINFTIIDELDNEININL